MIEVSHLTKRYGDHTAVSDLSFTIEKGQIYGFLGPNGAGKSTTMNIMTGCLAATEGTVKIDGYDIYEDAAQAKRLIGYLPEIPPLYGDRTPREYLHFVAEAKRIPKAEIASQIERVMAQTQITDVADRLCRNLSKGYRQRVGIAQALLGDPEIIILDEPTVGLDPAQIIEIRELIRELGKDHTVILSSHILSEVQAVCHTIMIISKGRLVACDTPENLEKLFTGTATIDITADGTAAELLPAIEAVPGITSASVTQELEDRTMIRIETKDDGADDVARGVFFALSDIRKPILSMSTVKASLEDIFIELTAAAEQDEETGAEETSETETEEQAGALAEEPAENAEEAERSKQYSKLN